MKVQVDRENRIKKQNQNYVIVEILLDGMNLYYRSTTCSIVHFQIYYCTRITRTRLHVCSVELE